MTIDLTKKLKDAICKWVAAFLTLLGLGVNLAHAQLKPNGIYYDFKLSATVSNVDGTAGYSGDLTFTYYTKWYSANNGSTVVPLDDGYGSNGTLTVSSATGVVSWMSGQSSSIPITSYTTNTDGTYKAVTWTPAAGSNKAYFNSMSFNVPGITNPNNLASSGFPVIDITSIGSRGTQYSFQDLVWVASSIDGTLLDQYYGGNAGGAGLNGVTISEIVVPEMNGALTPQVFLLLGGIFLILRNRRKNEIPYRLSAL